MTTDRDIPERWRDLKPCPFCGGEAQLEILGGPKSTHRTVRCCKCKCDLHFYPTEEMAIAKWNTRTAESLVRELAQALQDMCYSCIASDDGPILKEPDYDMLTRSQQVLEDVPAHLRAPETTSTGESSTVLRQEGKP